MLRTVVKVCRCCSSLLEATKLLLSTKQLKKELTACGPSVLFRCTLELSFAVMKVNIIVIIV
jgi:hypothetical protein